MNRRVPLIGLLLCIGIASANDALQEPVAFKATAKVVVDAQGVPQTVVASQALPEPIRFAVEQRVAEWRFEPLVIDGQPRTGSTHVFLEACAVPREDGGLSIAMEYTGNGPGYPDGELRLRLPEYPTDAMRSGSTGSFRVVVVVGADGSAVVESIQREQGSLRYFEAPLRAWASSLRYVPEEVDGVPVSTRISIPLDFTLARPSRRNAETRDSKACATASQGGWPRDPVVLDSPFRPLASG